MKAIRVSEFGDPTVMRLEETADPVPDAGEVVVRIEAAGVNPVDTYIRSGQYGRLPELPYTPGFDGAGVIETVGAGVEKLRSGDRVYISQSLTGTYAEKAACPASGVHRLPRGVSFQQGAAVSVPYATAYRALFQKARCLPPEIVLVHGASGGVGVAAIQLARAVGLRVVGTAGSERGRDLVRRESADLVLSHGEPGYLEELRDFTGGRGVDAILEMLANANLGKDLEVLAPGGRVVVIGSRGTVEVNPRELMTREASVIGMTLFSATSADLEEIHDALVTGLENRRLRPVVGRELSLAEAPRAHQEVMSPGSYGKIVLLP